MSHEENIRNKNNKFTIEKQINGKNYHFGSFDTFNQAKFIKELLDKNNWDLNKIKKLHPVFNFENYWIIIFIHEDKILILDKFKTKQEANKNIEKSIKKFIRNPFNSKYGLYINKNKNSFSISRRINGKSQRFGTYKNYEDAVFSRNLWVENEWDLDRIKMINPIQYDDEKDEYGIISIIQDKIHIICRFDSYDEAEKNLTVLLNDYTHEKYDKRYIAYNGKKYSIVKHVNNKFRYLSSFDDLEDAIAIRDILEDINWDFSKIKENIIFESADYYWKLLMYDNHIKVVGKFVSYDDAKENYNNMIKNPYKDINNPENPYKKVNRNIRKHLDKFYIVKRVDGVLKSFGSYDTRKEAINARDVLEKKNWAIDEKDSLFVDYESISDFLDIINNLTLWQKLIYDAFNSFGVEEVSFTQLKDHYIFKPYKVANFEKKLKKQLDSLVNLYLIEELDDGYYRKLW